MANPTPDNTTEAAPAATPASTVSADTTAVQQQSSTASDAPVTPAASDNTDAPATPSEGLSVTKVEPVQQTKPDPGIVVVEGDQPAQVVGTPFEPKTTVDVNEVHVVTDEVILDTSDPRAVQPGPSTPYGLTIGQGKTAEQQFAEAKSE